MATLRQMIIAQPFQKQSLYFGTVIADLRKERAGTSGAEYLRLSARIYQLTIDARNYRLRADEILAASSDFDQERRIRERDRAQHANAVDSGNSDHYF